MLHRQWGLPDDPAHDWKQLKTALKERLFELLEDDFAGLVNAMYRLDIAEDRFKAALDASSTDAIAAQLAEVVLQRELQRLETRRRYSDSNNNQQTE